MALRYVHSSPFLTHSHWFVVHNAYLQLTWGSLVQVYPLLLILYSRQIVEKWWFTMYPFHAQKFFSDIKNYYDLAYSWPNFPFFVVCSWKPTAVFATTRASTNLRIVKLGNLVQFITLEEAYRWTLIPYIASVLLRSTSGTGILTVELMNSLENVVSVLFQRVARILSFFQCFFFL